MIKQTNFHLYLIINIKYDIYLRFGSSLIKVLLSENLRINKHDIRLNNLTSDELDTLIVKIARNNTDSYREIFMYYLDDNYTKLLYI